MLVNSTTYLLALVNIIIINITIIIINHFVASICAPILLKGWVIISAIGEKKKKKFRLSVSLLLIYPHFLPMLTKKMMQPMGEILETIEYQPNKTIVRNCFCGTRLYGNARPKNQWYLWFIHSTTCFRGVNIVIVICIFVVIITNDYYYWY